MVGLYSAATNQRAITSLSPLLSTTEGFHRVNTNGDQHCQVLVAGMKKIIYNITTKS